MMMVMMQSAPEARQRAIQLYHVAAHQINLEAPTDVVTPVLGHMLHVSGCDEGWTSVRRL